MAIDATNPITIPAQPAVVYDQWYITDLHIFVADENNPDTVAVSTTLRASRTLDTGATELSPDGENRGFPISDLFAAAAQDPELATIIGTLSAKIQKMGVALGLL